MEELKEEKIINKLTNNSTLILNKIKSEKENENINNNNIKKDKEDKAINNNLSEPGKTLKKNENEVDDNKELEMIKLSHIKKYILCSEFRTHSFLLFSKVIFNEFSQLIGLLYIKKGHLNKYINMERYKDEGSK